MHAPASRPQQDLRALPMEGNREAAQESCADRRLSHPLSLSQAADLRTIHSLASSTVLKPPRFSSFPLGSKARTHHPPRSFKATGSNSTLCLTSSIATIWAESRRFARAKFRLNYAAAAQY